MLGEGLDYTVLAALPEGRREAVPEEHSCGLPLTSPCSSISTALPARREAALRAFPHCLWGLGAQAIANRKQALYHKLHLLA